MRLKKIIVSRLLLTHLLTEGEIRAKCVKGLPEGAEFHYMIAQAFDTYVQIVFSHKSWPELMDGDLIPVLETKFEKL